MPKKKVKEKWKPIKGYKSRYAVSNLGRVKSLERYVRNGKNTKRLIKEKILTPSRKRGEYLHVQLWKNNKTKPRKVHRLVLEAFIGPLPKGMECCHNDGNPRNNKLSNLRYDTRNNNHKDKRTHGTTPIGERNGTSKLTEKEVKEILLSYSKNNITQKQLADKYRVDQQTICNIVRRKIWKHVKGADCSNAGRVNVKLTEKSVRKIRNEFEKGGVTKTYLGRKYGVSAVQICYIISRKSWAYVE